ncbi:MAG: hypothetical protein P4M13_10335 [Alphaproteobacteria bacterium]|nr:hypothetical protein [Alphaproteobacteria bacterium]
MTNEFPAFLQDKPRSERSLFDYLCCKINPKIDLVKISEADYGMDAKEHYEKLFQIYSTGEMPRPLTWNPREVLELTKWSQPDDPKWKPGTYGERDHLQRAFSCCVLLVCADDYSHEYSDLISRLIESCLVWGRDSLPLLEELILWKLLKKADNEEYSFCALGYLLTYCLRRKKKDKDEAFLSELFRWFIECANLAAQSSDFSSCSPKYVGSSWLFASTPFEQSFDVWRSMIRKALFLQEENFPLSLRKEAKDLGEKLIAAIGRSA